MGLVGQRTGRRWQMGDTVRVRLSRVDLTQRQIDFELLDAEAARLARHGARAAPRRASIERGAAPARRRRARRRAARRAADVADSQAQLGLWAARHRARSSSARRSASRSSGSPRRATMRGCASLRERAQAAGVHVQTAGSEALAKLVGDVAHQGAVAAVRPLKPWDEHDLAAALGKRCAIPCCWCSMGSPTRTISAPACARPMRPASQAVIIPKDRAAAVDGVVRKVAAGAAEFVPVATVTNLARTLAVLKEQGIWVVGTDGERRADPVRAPTSSGRWPWSWGRRAAACGA